MRHKKSATESVSLDEDHVYRVGKRRVSGVTEIIRSAKLVDERWFTPEARERGRIVHKIAQLEDDGRLDPSSIDNRLLGYVEAYRRFKSDVGFKPLLVEWMFHNPMLDYCGTLDRLGTAGKNILLVDLKTGDVGPWVGLQLAGYQLGILGHPKAKEWFSMGEFQKKALQLNRNGTYRLHAFDDPVDVESWASFVSVHRWIKRRQS